MSQAPRPNRTLAEAVAAADASVTVLDDKIDIEDAAVYRWLRGHQVHAGRFHHLVVGSQPLPPAWRATAIKITSDMQATHLLQSVGRDPVAARALGTALREMDPRSATASASEVNGKVAAALATGRMWAIEVRRPPHSRFSTRTSPTAFAPINPALGTNVDFAFIAGLEGNQWLRGYIPMKRTGIVIGRSGMTVASGFDVGQWSQSELSSFGFPPALVAKLKPFAAHPFKGRSKEQVAATVAKLGPVPILTKAEADLCDGAVFKKILSDASNLWDRQAIRGIVHFNQLPSGWQTVWLSRVYQEGVHTNVSLGKKFRSEAVHGEWAEAVKTLRSYTDYRARARTEAVLLESELPPEPADAKEKSR